MKDLIHKIMNTPEFINFELEDISKKFNNAQKITVHFAFSHGKDSDGVEMIDIIHKPFILDNDNVGKFISENGYMQAVYYLSANEYIHNKKGEKKY